MSPRPSFFARFSAPRGPSPEFTKESHPGEGVLSRLLPWAGGALLVAGVVRYDSATPEEVLFLLSPLAWLLESFLGSPFLFFPGEGYVSPSMGIRLTAGCSGGNFLLVSLFMALLFTTRQRFRGANMLRFPLLILVSYLLTLVADFSRILIALFSERFFVLWEGGEGWSSYALYLLNGSFVYMVFLVLFYFVLRHISNGTERDSHSGREASSE